VTSNYGSSYRLVLIGLLVLITACSQVRPTPPPGSVTSQSAQTRDSTPTLPAEHTATPEPTPTRPIEATVTAPTQPATPTKQVPDTPLPSREDTPQSTPSATVPPQTFPPAISLEPVLGGFELPVFVTHAGEEASGASRLFTVEKAGRILLVENSVVQPTPFLDITDRVGSQRNEQGLLSVAFPPTSPPAGSSTSITLIGVATPSLPATG
jgi:cytoskeletal protein RodZ